MSRLIALEAGDWRDFDAWVYLRGAVRGYARAIGLDQEDVILKLQHDVEGISELGSAAVNKANPVFSMGSVRTVHKRRPGVLVPLVMLVLIAAAVGLGISLRSERAQQDTPAAVAPEPVAPQAASETTGADVTAGTPATVAVGATLAKSAQPAPKLTPQQHEPSGADHELVFHAIETAWVRIEVDGGAAREFTLPQGHRYSVRAAQTVTVYTGNAGGLMILLDGEPQPLLGESGQVRRRTFRFAGDDGP